jgi:mono/diheme cytochrome c family protein
VSTGRAAVAGAAAAVALGAAAFGWTSHPGAAREPPLDGASLFHAKGCATCHTGPGPRPAAGGDFPDLSDAPEWAGERRPGMDAAEYLAQSIREPWAFISPAFTGGSGPTTGMPGLGVSEAETDALVAYLLES